LKVTDTLIEPLEDDYSALFGDAWDELLDLIHYLFRGRSKVSLDLLGVQVKETNVGRSWKLSLEVLLVVFEQV